VNQYSDLAINDKTWLIATGCTLMGQCLLTDYCKYYQLFVPEESCCCYTGKPYFLITGSMGFCGEMEASL